MKNISWKRFRNTKNWAPIQSNFTDISNYYRKIPSYWYLAILSNFKSGAEIIGFLLFGKYLADVSRIENCDAP